MVENLKNIIEELSDQLETAERYNLYWLKSDLALNLQMQESLNLAGIKTVNIGFEFAKKLSLQKASKFIGIEAHELLQNLIENNSTLLNKLKIKTVALYNLGVLFEPDLELDPSQIIKNLSKTTAIILLWENLSDDNGNLFWDKAQPQYGFDFTDTNIREIKIHHEIQ